MSQLASRAQFHGGEQTQVLYTDYRRYPCFAQRADWIREHYPRARSVLVVGCAYGYLVDELRQRQVHAWGIEASEYAVSRTWSEIGPNARYVLHGDAILPADLAVCCAAACAMPFDLVVTEDVISVCSDAEVKKLLRSVRIVGQELLHIVTPGLPGDRHTVTFLNLKPIEQWARLCSPDPVLDARKV